jgi:hypothetical protein
MSTIEFALLGLVVLNTLVLGLFFDREFNRNHNAMQALSAALTDYQTALNSPVIKSIADGLASSVPQDAYNKSYDFLNSVISIIGQNSDAGKLLAQGESILKGLDHDPSNDMPPNTDPGAPGESLELPHPDAQA